MQFSFNFVSIHNTMKPIVQFQIHLILTTMIHEVQLPEMSVTWHSGFFMMVNGSLKVLYEAVTFLLIKYLRIRPNPPVHK